MSTHARTIRGMIEQCKGHIITSAGRWFDACGYVGKTAIKELRAAGRRIEYNRALGSYRLLS